MNVYYSLLEVLTAVFTVLLVIDVFTTTLVLNMGGTELNPLMGGIADQPWLHILIKTLFAMFVVILACQAERLKQHSGVIILIAACSMFLVVAVHNIRVVLFSFLG